MDCSNTFSLAVQIYQPEAWSINKQLPVFSLENECNYCRSGYLRFRYGVQGDILVNEIKKACRAGPSSLWVQAQSGKVVIPK